MKVMTKKFLFILLIGLFLLGVGQLGQTEKWQPYQFKGNERFEYKIIWNENEEPVEITYILDIKIDPEKFQESEDEDKMLAEWVIDPELALPLSSKTFGDDGIEGEIELIEYVQY